ncbi:MAG: hypothetical protein M3312_02260 [Actinomycetota bacterium]|jgi:hypothetical protein|nr:hypothetical protein [Actinomycetota bacterium]
MSPRDVAAVAAVAAVFAAAAVDAVRRDGVAAAPERASAPVSAAASSVAVFPAAVTCRVRGTLFACSRSPRTSPALARYLEGGTRKKRPER